MRQYCIGIGIALEQIAITLHPSEPHLIHPSAIHCIENFIM